MAEPTITYADDACVIGTLANVCASIWRGECTVARNDEWVRASRDLGRRLGTPIAVISIVTEGAPTPPSAIRTAQGRFLEDLSRTAFAAGVIVDGVGFRAGLVRAVVASVSALARYKCPFRVVATDAEMAQWLQERSASLPSGAVGAVDHELCSLFAALRARLAG
ncbi:MAG: hypothetical protein ACMG6S_18165 [Byssovorax sp.]